MLLEFCEYLKAPDSVFSLCNLYKSSTSVHTAHQQYHFYSTIWALLWYLSLVADNLQPPHPSTKIHCRKHGSAANRWRLDDPDMIIITPGHYHIVFEW